VQGADVWVDDDAGVVEVGVAALQAGEFAPAGAGVGGGDQEYRGPGADEGGGVVGEVHCLVGGGPDVFESFVVVASAAAAGRMG
jgi:hypothetical protein